MDLVYTDKTKKDIGFLEPIYFDLAFGIDQNNFECQLDISEHCLQEDSFIYVEGAEYGGIVDGVKIDTSSDTVTYFGRTWHGILEGKIFTPTKINQKISDVEYYKTFIGDANIVLRDIVSLFNLGDLFATSNLESGININYKMPAYTSGYQGIVDMLKSSGAKLKMIWKFGKVELSALPIDVYDDNGINSFEHNFKIERYRNLLNHLIIKGNVEEHGVLRIHLFVDENGIIQPYSSVNPPVKTSDYILDMSKQIQVREQEIVGFLNIDNAKITINYVLQTSRPSDWSTNYKKYYYRSGDDYEAVEGSTAPTWKSNYYYTAYEDAYAEMVAKGIETISTAWQSDKCDFSLDTNEAEFDIGDEIVASESITGISVMKTVVKKIFKLKENEIDIEYEVQ